MTKGRHANESRDVGRVRSPEASRPAARSRHLYALPRDCAWVARSIQANRNERNRSPALGGSRVRICLPQLLNVAAMDQSGNMQNRRSRRAPVLLAATLEVRGVPTTVKLRNL